MRLFFISTIIFRDLSNNDLQRLPSDIFNNLAKMEKL